MYIFLFSWNLGTRRRTVCFFPRSVYICFLVYIYVIWWMNQINFDTLKFPTIRTKARKYLKPNEEMKELLTSFSEVEDLEEAEGASVEEGWSLLFKLAPSLQRQKSLYMHLFYCSFPASNYASSHPLYRRINCSGWYIYMPPIIIERLIPSSYGQKYISTITNWILSNSFKIERILISLYIY